MKLQQAGSPRSPLRGVLQAYRYALDPTPTQERRLRSHAGAARFAWNWALTRVKARYEAEKKWYSAEELQRLWNVEKKTKPDLAWWQENSKCVYQEAFRNCQWPSGMTRLWPTQSRQRRPRATSPSTTLLTVGGEPVQPSAGTS